jgi:hypothetical protein
MPDHEHFILKDKTQSSKTNWAEGQVSSIPE